MENTKDQKSSELTKTIKKLEHENNNLKKALDNAISGSIIIGKDGRIRFVNKAWNRIYGYTGSEVLGEKKGEYELSENKSFESEKEKYEEATHKKKDGTKITVLIKSNELESGETINSVTDISLQKQKEVELLKKTEELTKINSLMINRELKMIELKSKMKKRKGVENEKNIVRRR